MENFFGGVNEDYYKPVKTKSAINSNYKEYESREDKDRKLSIKYFFMIRLYLRDMLT